MNRLTAKIQADREIEKKKLLPIIEEITISLSIRHRYSNAKDTENNVAYSSSLVVNRISLSPKFVDFAVVTIHCSACH